MASVNRHLPPLGGVTEIRVHGVGGTTPEALLEQTGVQQVAGDDKAGFFRGAIPTPNRSVEAYSWGGLTARSRSRAFWVLLLPFSMINLAGWMVEPHHLPSGDLATADRSDVGTRVHEAVVQVIAIASTAMYVMWTALITVNTLAFQCGAIAACREDHWYLQFFGSSVFVDHPGRRVLVGLAVPLLLLILFKRLGTVSRERYDDYGQTGNGGGEAVGEGTSVSFDTVEQSGSAIGRPRFWFPGEWQQQSSRIHVGCSLSILAGLLGRAAGLFEREFGQGVAAETVGTVVFWSALGVALVGVAAIVAATFQSGVLLGDGVGWFGPVSQAVLVAAVLLFATAAARTGQLEAPDADLLASLATGMVEPVTDYWGFGWAPLLLLTLAIGLVGLFSSVQIARWIQWRALNVDQMIPVGMLVLIVLWEWAVAASVVMAVLVALAHLLQGSTHGNDSPDVTAPPATWRLGLSLGFLAAGALLAVATQGLPEPFGVAWPRLTPALSFTMLLVVLSLIQSTGRMNRTASASTGVRVALVILPAGIVATGAALTWWLNRDEWFHGAIGVAWSVMAIVWLAQFGHARWRWNGPAAVALTGLSIVMGAFSGLMIWLVDLLDGDGLVFVLRATAIYQWLTVIFFAMLVVLVTGMAGWAVLATLDPGSRRPATMRVPRGERLPMVLRATDATLTMAAMVSLSSIVALAIHLAQTHGMNILAWIDDGPPDDWAGIVGVSSWVSLGVVLGAGFVIRQGLKDHAFRTKFGVLWDVATFWPRSFHPFAPPSYATRAVPELQRRLAEIVEAPVPVPDPDAASPGRACSAAILSGHSQGSVISLAVMATLHPRIRRNVWLVTHGSPLASLYRRFFPNYFSDDLFAHVASVDGSAVEEGRWLNFHRPTDPIGGPCFEASCRDEAPTGSVPAWSRAALDGSGDDGRCLPDVRLPDPVRTPPGPYEPRPQIRGHSGYMADPAMWRALDVLADHLSTET